MDKQFGKTKLIKDISANTIQIAITQIFSLVIFYITSRYLAKDDFGELNWSTAVGSTVIALASLGLDVVFVKRLASGENALTLSGIHFFHTVVVGLVLSLLIFSFDYVFPSFIGAHPLFFMVFINLCILNIANSFRLALMGLEVYKYLAVLALITNLFKFFFIVTLYVTHHFSIMNVIYVFILTSLLEFLLGYYLVNRSIKNRIKPLLKVVEYKYFILESLPQLGVVFFDSALARVDWILLGILSTASITAEYSFAYRMYESSKLPLLVIAPILLTRFSKLFVNPDKINGQNRNEIEVFFKLELFIVMLIPVVLICVWAPLIDYFTDNKYGSSNELNYIVLAACVPLHCISNFLWSMGFAQGQLKTIMYITIAVALINLLLNLFLIPNYGALGAAFAFLISTFFQTLLYIKYMKQDHIRLDVKSSILAFVNALIAVITAKFLTNNAIFATLISVSVLTVLALITNQINYKQIKTIIKP